MAPSVSDVVVLPRDEETHLWQLSLHEVKRYRVQWLSWLSVDEQDRAQRFFRQADRDRFILSRGALRYLLGRYLCCSPQSLAFGYSAYGKPSLSHPQTQLHFNLAHSKDWTVYAFSRCAWVGVDVEAISQRNYLEALIDRCLTEDESSSLPVNSDARLVKFLQHWTLKEAHLKATGLGLSYPMNQIQVSWRPTVHLKQPAKISNDTVDEWTTMLWYPDAEAIAAACVGQANHRFLIRSFLVDSSPIA